MDATRRLLLASLCALMGACAAMHSLHTEVSTWGEWPAGRAPGRYAIERLPSQQARSAEIEPLERALAPALAKAGFVPATDAATAEVLVQVGLRESRADRWPWDDPAWWGVAGWGPGWAFRRPTPWLAPRFALPPEPARWEREVAVLIRDRASGKPLYEARASAEGLSGSRASPAVVGALFAAALADFPHTGVNPRPVLVPLAP